MEQVPTEIRHRSHFVRQWNKFVNKFVQKMDLERERCVFCPRETVFLFNLFTLCFLPQRIRSEASLNHDFSLKDSRKPEFRSRNRYRDVSPCKCNFFFDYFAKYFINITVQSSFFKILHLTRWTEQKEFWAQDIMMTFRLFQPLHHRINCAE